MRSEVSPAATDGDKSCGLMIKKDFVCLGLAAWQCYWVLLLLRAARKSKSPPAPPCRSGGDFTFLPRPRRSSVPAGVGALAPGTAKLLPSASQQAGTSRCAGARLCRCWGGRHEGTGAPDAVYGREILVPRVVAD